MKTFHFALLCVRRRDGDGDLLFRKFVKAESFFYCRYWMLWTFSLKKSLLKSLFITVGNRRIFNKNKFKIQNFIFQLSYKISQASKKKFLSPKNSKNQISFAETLKVDGQKWDKPFLINLSLCSLTSDWTWANFHCLAAQQKLLEPIFHTFVAERSIKSLKWSCNCENKRWTEVRFSDDCKWIA